jgi:hypothetical protein
MSAHVANYGVMLTGIVVISILFSTGDSTAAATTTRSTATLKAVETRSETQNTRVTKTRATLVPPKNRTGAKLDSTARTRIQNLTANLSNRHEAAIERLEQISDRAKARTNEFADAGYNTNNAQRALNAADTALANARRTLRRIDTDVFAVVYSATPRKDWPQLRTIYSLSAQSIRDAKAALRITINELRNVSQSNNNPDDV